MSSWWLGWKMIWRDWRAGELRLLIASVVVAIAALTCVGFFADRMRAALNLEARQLLGADLVLRADRPIDPSIIARARDSGLLVAQTVTFPSMASVPGREDTAPQLVSLKAVSPGYPLRGRLRISTDAAGADRAADDIPASGTVWIDPQLLAALGLKIGDSLRLGDRDFRVAYLIALEPDRGANFINFAPRALIRSDELAATNLLQPASRISYRMLFAGEPQAVSRFSQTESPALPRGQQFESLSGGGRPELRATLDRAEQFLSLVALLTALVASVAIALAARRFAARHVDSAAVLRALGATQRQLLSMFAIEMLAVGIAASLIGALIGLATHGVLVGLMRPMMALDLPPPGVMPLAQGLIAGITLLSGFALLPIARLAGVPAMRVLRRDLGPPALSVRAGLAAAVVAFAVLLGWFAGDRKLALYALGGFAGAVVVFALGSWLLVRLVRPLRQLAPAGGAGGLIRLSLAAWSRREGASVAQTAALAVALMALILLSVVHEDLLASWRRASPPDAPNRFVINIQPDQREPFAELLAGYGVKSLELYPMVRGRLVAVNDEPIELRTGQPRSGDSGGAAPNAQGGGQQANASSFDRELNLSYTERIPTHNQTVTGRWVDPQAAEVSVEESFFKWLRLSLGDQLSFDIAGATVKVKVVGVRKLAWDSMKVNFYMLLSAAALADQPQTLITAFHAPAAAQRLSRDLLAQFPNLTVIDVSQIVAQVQRILDQIARAVSFLFLFTLAAGVLVLYAALLGSRDERVREAALLRALGATRRQLLASQLLELALGGALAGSLAALAAAACAALLAEYVFKFSYGVPWRVLPIGMLAGLACALLGGWLGLRGVLNAPALRSLREA